MVIQMEYESDTQRMQAAPKRAFDWVAQELTLPNEQVKSTLCDAYLSTANAGERQAARALAFAWTEGCEWKSGEAFLQSKGAWDVSDLMALLYGRLCQVAHRIYCDEQVRRVLDPSSPHRITAYTHGNINRHEFRDDDFCGQGIDRIVSIEEALRFLEQPAHAHPACSCTVDPFPVCSSDASRLRSA